ncbi:MAG: deoxyribodipyrimidine photo-lyase [Ignisphaera sp.]|nr:DNA photolyase family protein [Ignisphaera sp.]MDW8084789.1 deoxyribodipyrimidine photo-lyase [Ignisphaera sp.]
MSFLRILYWFRRDLRFRDNRALAEAISRADEVVAIYIIDTDLMRDLGMNSIDARFHFLIDVLKELSRRIELHTLYGRTRDVVEHLLGRYHFDALYTAAPLSWSDEAKVREVEGLCLSMGIRFHQVVDNVLVDPSLIHSAPNFSSFYRQWVEIIDSRIVGEINTGKFRRVDESNVDELAAKHGWKAPRAAHWKADWVEYRLRTFNFAEYDRLKDYPYLDGTSKLSPYINLGVVSVRELYRAVSEQSKEFVRQLAWREYYYHLKRRYPFMRSLELKPHMRRIEWENRETLIELFKEGKTGYPIIDAGIRQLRMENWMHNRVRLIVSSFLVKDLHVDWRIGEEFFKKYLIDYDEPLNIGNWQWAASVGVDPLPLRIFNPIKQSERYDPMCIYIKKYVPELEGYECRELHNPLRYRLKGYHEPIVDHYQRVKEFKNRIRS